MTSGTVPAPELSGGDGRDPRGHCHLLMEGGENKRLLADWLGREFRVTDGSTTDTIPDTFDLCILDGSNYGEHATALGRRKRDAEPEFLPALLVTNDADRLDGNRSIWEVVDDVVETPIRRAELAARIDNLLVRRRTASRLAERERSLAETVSELERKDLAMDAAPVGITLSDPHQDGHPITYVNAAFERITGYDREEVLGREFDFLRGPDTDPERIETLNDALENDDRVTVTLVNYRKNGRRFWNRVEIAPVYDATGTLMAHVSFRTDVTDQQIRQQRLTVLNRVMRHNLSNELNVIEGYARTLLESPGSGNREEPLGHIIDAARSLEKLSGTASWIERVLDRCRADATPTAVGEVVRRVRERLEAEHPDVDFAVEFEGAPYHVRGNGIEEALSEVLGNAARHGRGTVSISVGPHEDVPEHVEVTVVDDGPGIPMRTAEVLRRGEETPLNHGDGLGLWLVFWVVTHVGGSIDVTTPDDGGTVIQLALPTCDPPDH